MLRDGPIVPIRSGSLENGPIRAARPIWIRYPKKTPARPIGKMAPVFYRLSARNPRGARNRTENRGPKKTPAFGYPTFGLCH
jgi:hypothetical protein